MLDNRVLHTLHCYTTCAIPVPTLITLITVTIVTQCLKLWRWGGGGRWLYGQLTVILYKLEKFLGTPYYGCDGDTEFLLSYILLEPNWWLQCHVGCGHSTTYLPCYLVTRTMITCRWECMVHSVCVMSPFLFRGNEGPHLGDWVPARH